MIKDKTIPLTNTILTSDTISHQLRQVSRDGFQQYREKEQVDRRRDSRVSAMRVRAVLNYLKW